MPRTWADGGVPALSAANLNDLEAELLTSLWSAAALAAKTANYTATATDKVLIYNGASITATLPDPTTVANRIYIIKNINATALTVVSAGTSKTIDGAASLLIPQYLVLTVVSDGAAWHILAGGEVLPSTANSPVILGSSANAAVLTISSSNSNGTTQPTLHLRNELNGSSITPQNVGLKVSQGIAGGNPIEFWANGTRKFYVDNSGVPFVGSNAYGFWTGSGYNPEGNAQGANGLFMTNTSDNGGLWFKSNATNSYTGWHPVGQSSSQSTKTANYTINGADQITIGNGTSITFTLPDPTTAIHKNRIFILKNINSTSLTVVSAGTSKTIDGAASQSLAQWAKMSVICTGTQWLIV